MIQKDICPKLWKTLADWSSHLGLQLELQKMVAAEGDAARTGKDIIPGNEEETCIWGVSEYLHVGWWVK